MGGCLVMIFQEDFAPRCSDTVFDHILFNHAQRMPAVLSGASTRSNGTSVMW